MKLHVNRALLLACVAMSWTMAADREAMAGEPQSLHISGSGMFSPVNIGTPHGGNFGFVIGDGSGVSTYETAGDTDPATTDIPPGDFLIGDQRVGPSGFNHHAGKVFSATTGIRRGNSGVVRWPGRNEGVHVLTSHDGQLHVHYIGTFTLDLAALAAGQPGSFGAVAWAKFVGGTGRFEGATGFARIDVTVPIALPVPPPQHLPAAPFNYEFNGYIVLQD